MPLNPVQSTILDALYDFCQTRCREATGKDPEELRLELDQLLTYINRAKKKEALAPESANEIIDQVALLKRLTSSGTSRGITAQILEELKRTLPNAENFDAIEIFIYSTTSGKSAGASKTTHLADVLITAIGRAKAEASFKIAARSLVADILPPVTATPFTAAETATTESTAAATASAAAIATPPVEGEELEPAANELDESKTPCQVYNELIDIVDAATSHQDEKNIVLVRAYDVLKAYEAELADTESPDDLIKKTCWQKIRDNLAALQDDEPSVATDGLAAIIQQIDREIGLEQVQLGMAYSSFHNYVQEKLPFTTQDKNNLILLVYDALKSYETKYDLSNIDTLKLEELLWEEIGKCLNAYYDDPTWVEHLLTAVRKDSNPEALHEKLSTAEQELLAAQAKIKDLEEALATRTRAPTASATSTTSTSPPAVTPSTEATEPDLPLPLRLKLSEEDKGKLSALLKKRNTERAEIIAFLADVPTDKITEAMRPLNVGAPLEMVKKNPAFQAQAPSRPAFSLAGIAQPPKLRTTAATTSTDTDSRAAVTTPPARAPKPKSAEELMREQLKAAVAKRQTQATSSAIADPITARQVTLATAETERRADIASMLTKKPPQKAALIVAGLPLLDSATREEIKKLIETKNNQIKSHESLMTIPETRLTPEQIRVRQDPKQSERLAQLKEEVLKLKALLSLQTQAVVKAILLQFRIGNSLTDIIFPAKLSGNTYQALEKLLTDKPEIDTERVHRLLSKLSSDQMDTAISRLQTEPLETVETAYSEVTVGAARPRAPLSKRDSLRAPLAKATSSRLPGVTSPAAISAGARAPRASTLAPTATAFGNVHAASVAPPAGAATGVSAENDETW